MIDLHLQGTSAYFLIKQSLLESLPNYLREGSCCSSDKPSTPRSCSDIETSSQNVRPFIFSYWITSCRIRARGWWFWYWEFLTSRHMGLKLDFPEDDWVGGHHNPNPCLSPSCRRCNLRHLLKEGWLHQRIKNKKKGNKSSCRPSHGNVSSHVCLSNCEFYAFLGSILFQPYN